MSTESPIPPVFRALVDDAALFPPGNAPMPVAVAEHRHHRSAPYADLVGPLLIPVARWHELVCCLDAEPGRVPLDVGLIGAAGDVAAALPTVTGDDRVRLGQVECPITDDAELPDALARLDPALPAGCALAVEIPRRRGWLDLVARVPQRHAGRPVWVKLRTGGLTADAFPSDGELTDFLGTALGAGQPFKLTAGLHRAVRYTDPATGFEHHGFGNVLAAVGEYLRSGRRSAVADQIASTAATPVRAALRALVRDERAGRAARDVFRSYGSCSVAEPLTELSELGLLDSALLSHLPGPRRVDA